MGKITKEMIEIIIAKYFNWRVNIIVPNISWGLYIHECDLLIITPAGYAYEVEIKTNKNDLIRDASKKHGHNNKKIKKLYFAIPDDIYDENNIPERAGIILIKQNKYGDLSCEKIKEAQNNGNYKFSEKERFNVARLGAMRIWHLKEKSINIMKYCKDCIYFTAEMGKHIKGCYLYPYKITLPYTHICSNFLIGKKEEI